ncbi:MAG: hypothetical protein MK209_07410 [Planctomycetes bacterium]|nr:hypothetical protein [Planctomycetota bacterium]
MITAFTATLLLAVAAPQEVELELTNGKILKVRAVKSESYQEVIYTTSSGGESRKDASEVLEVRHDLSAKMLDDYAASIEAMDTGEFGKAAAILDTVLADDRLMERARYAWVKQHALFRKARCQFAMADAAGVSGTVDALIAQVPATFFYAQALMLKAQILAISGKDSDAKAVFNQLSSDVSAKDLPERWAREAELGLALLDKGGDAKVRERKLAGLAEKNSGKFPTVASRANVEIGNVMVETGDYDKAQLFFERIVKGGQADSTTMASAYSGLGDCFYFRAVAMENASKEDRREQFERAALHHLRVITMHKDAIHLVPRSHYFAAQALRQMNTSDTASQGNQLASRLRRLYPQSSWWERLKREWNLR